MEFKFTVQDYQTRAANAVAQVFDGQPKVEGQQYVRDLGTGLYDAKSARGSWHTRMPTVTRTPRFL